jgi:hypothetical protein
MTTLEALSERLDAMAKALSDQAARHSQEMASVHNREIADRDDLRRMFDTIDSTLEILTVSVAILRTKTLGDQ